MRAWRITRRLERTDAFTGKLAAEFGGRWNPPDIPAVYLASSLALAVLEVLAHADPAFEPQDLLAIPVDIPEDMTRQQVAAAGLPPDWQQHESEYCRRVGIAWHEAGKHAFLEVPSAVIPLKRNLVANPRHADFSRVDLSHYGYPLRFDPRLIGIVDVAAT